MCPINIRQCHAIWGDCQGPIGLGHDLITYTSKLILSQEDGSVKSGSDTALQGASLRMAIQISVSYREFVELQIHEAAQREKIHLQITRCGMKVGSKSMDSRRVVSCMLDS